MEGTECNVCREGSFYLDPANPKGCTSCFCFGINSHCHSTHKRRAKVCKGLEFLFLFGTSEWGKKWIVMKYEGLVEILYLILLKC